MIRDYDARVVGADRLSFDHEILEGRDRHGLSPLTECGDRRLAHGGRRRAVAGPGAQGAHGERVAHQAHRLDEAGAGIGGEGACARRLEGDCEQLSRSLGVDREATMLATPSDAFEPSYLMRFR